MDIRELATSVLAYASWPSLTLAVIFLWAEAMLDVLRHKSRGTFTDKGLLGMAAVVSVVAVVAISSICALFAGSWSEAVSRASTGGTQASDAAGEVPGRAHIFSFGLENASYGRPLDSTGAARGENSLSR
jgi:hypothetical protein